MKKFISLVAVALFTLPIFAEDVVVVLDSIDFRNDEIVIKQGAASPGDSVLAVKEGVTIGIDKGQNKGFCLTAFAHSSVTISATQNIKQLNFEFGQAGGSAKDGGLDAQIAVGATEWTAVDLPSQARFAKITITLGEGKGEEQTFDTISVARALEIANALEEPAANGQSTTDATVYVVAGFAVNVYDKNTDETWTFNMADEAGAYGEFFASNTSTDSDVAKNDFMYVKGKIAKRKTNSGNIQLQIYKGTGTHGEAPQGIENVVLTEKANKVMVDGVMYIVRDGKMFNLQGAQVR